MASPKFVGKDLRGRDLRWVDFSGEPLFQTDLRGASLHQAVISLDCATFSGVKLDDQQVALFLLMLSSADIDVKWKASLVQLVREQVGDSQLDVLQRYLRLLE